MPPTFGGAPKCTTCSKSVYFAEEQRGPGGKIYHKGCLRCLSCNKALDALHLVDHDGDTCHSKLFGPKGYGNGGVLVGEYTDRFSPSPSPSPANSPHPIPLTKPVPPPKPSFSTSNRLRQSFPSPSPLSARHNAVPVVSDRATSPTRSSAASTEASEGGWRGREVMGERTGMGTGQAAVGMAKYGGAGRDLCRRCGTVVYFAESVLAAGQKWHKRCLRCASCETALSSSSMTDRDGLPYCKKCYSDQFGLQSQGLMSRIGLY